MRFLFVFNDLKANVKSCCSISKGEEFSVSTIIHVKKKNCISCHYPKVKVVKTKVYLCLRNSIRDLWNQRRIIFWFWKIQTFGISRLTQSKLAQSKLALSKLIRSIYLFRVPEIAFFIDFLRTQRDFAIVIFL